MILSELKNWMNLLIEDDAEMFAETLEIMLDDIHSNDGFGTEGQCDPRGDFRSGKWSMKKVQS